MTKNKNLKFFKIFAFYISNITKKSKGILSYYKIIKKFQIRKIYLLR